MILDLYKINDRWRHGELSWSQKMTSRRVTNLREDNETRIFLSVEDWYEQVQINLGPNVGDITIEYN